MSGTQWPHPYGCQCGLHRTIPDTPTAPPICTCTAARRCRPGCHGPSPAQWIAATEAAERERRDLERVTLAARQPHVDVSIPATSGNIRLQSCSGGLEAVWVRVRDEEGQQVSFDRVTGRHLAAPVRLTPSQARALAAVLVAYADSHPSVGEEL